MSEKYILVVDDDPDLVETVAMMLESKGCEVGRAYDGIEGEESIKERRPDLVILDIMMPRKDGYVLCNELKANDATRDIPVVLLTAQDVDPQKIKLDMVPVVSKTEGFENVIKIIDELL